MKFSSHIMGKRVHPNLKRGDHIRVWRGTYYHHGIYCGNGTIIHYTGEVARKKNAIIQQDTLATFTDGGSVEIATYSEYFPPNEVVQRAQSRLGEKQYRLVFNNCEHFAQWCKIGEHKSQQVNLVFHTVTRLMIKPWIVTLAEGIYRIYTSEMDKSNVHEHLPQNALLLFQHFKEAYEKKDVKKIADRISEAFYSDRYGSTKQDFLRLMTSTFRGMKYGLNPHLRINVYNVTSNTSEEFSIVIDMQARFKLLWIPTPIKYDTAKLVCEARAEGAHNYWRVTKVLKFKG